MALLLHYYNNTKNDIQIAMAPIGPSVPCEVSPSKLLTALRQASKQKDWHLPDRECYSKAIGSLLVGRSWSNSIPV